jgi:N-acetylneuraminic acid mutarotase
MIVWGGSEIEIDIPTNTGGRYDPASDTWVATSTTNAPSARDSHAAVWTGSEMIVWGGFGIPLTNTGGRYDPASDTWVATSTTNAPSPRSGHTAVWTGSEMIVWGGINVTQTNNTGGRYNPATDTWVATSTTWTTPSARSSHRAVWTGSEMIVWGGVPSQVGNPTNTGGRYDPASDTWVATSTANAPSGRYLHTAVWTGSEMIVWGGSVSGFVTETGSRYCALAPAALR